MCIHHLLFLVHQRSGLFEWEEQILRSGVPAIGRSDPVLAGSDPLFPASRGGAGTRGETDQAALSTQPTESLPRRGACVCLCSLSHNQP